MITILHVTPRATTTNVESLLGGLATFQFHASRCDEALALCSTIMPDLVVVDSDAGAETLFPKRVKSLVSPTLPIVLVRDTETTPEDPSVDEGYDDVVVPAHGQRELLKRCSRLIMQKRASQSLIEENAKVADLLRRREEMTTLLIHDMKSPLAAVMTNLEFLRAGSEETSAAAAVEDSIAACRRVLRITVNILDVARMEEGKLDPNFHLVALRDVVGDCLRYRYAAAERERIRLIVEIPRDLRVRIDRNLIGRVLENLIDNAVRYAGVGGEIRMWSSVEGDRARLFVGNTGPAIPEARRAVVFQKYASGGGHMSMGLGLYFCRLAVMFHGGTLEISERPDLPCTFELTLPRDGD